MRQLLPEPDEVDVAACHAAAERPAPPDRPWVLVNMVATVDGATAVAGRSGDLGGDGDREVFRALRAVADVILVAAGTVRAEGYGPATPSEDRRRERRERGQTPRPRLAVVSGSLDLDPASSLFTASDEPPLIYTTDSADEECRARFDDRAEVVTAGEGPVDVAAVLHDLHRRGHRTVLVEGGPTLNGQLVAADLVDELNLTIAPDLVGGDSLRAAAGGAEVRLPLGLAHLWSDDDVLFARYVRRR